MIPTALPTMNAGLKLAVGSAFGGALVAEFISAQAGMGILMARYTMSLNMPSAFAGTAFNYPIWFPTVQNNGSYRQASTLLVG